MDKKPLVLIMAGGTGGHIFPGLAVAQVLQEKGCEVMWLGTKQGLEAKLVPQHDIPVIWLQVGGVRGKNIIKRVIGLLQFTWATLKMTFTLLKLKPKVAVGMGGFVSASGAMAAKLTGCPLVIHEQNALAGFTNKMLSKMANTVLQAFPSAFPNAITIGNPIRASIAALPSPKERFVGEHKPLHILVVGGSLGALVLNTVLPKVFAKFSSIEIKHQTGQKHIEKTQENYKEQGIKAEVLAFIEDMADAYGWADLVICRAGALTISEIAAAGIGSILIPYPYAVDDHQTYNAKFLTHNNAAILIPETEFSEEKIYSYLEDLLNNPKKLLEMAEKAKELAKIDSAEQAAEYCLKVARK